MQQECNSTVKQQEQRSKSKIEIKIKIKESSVTHLPAPTLTIVVALVSNVNTDADSLRTSPATACRITVRRVCGRGKNPKSLRWPVDAACVSSDKRYLGPFVCL
jgi:hypothetical protein